MGVDSSKLAAGIVRSSAQRSWQPFVFVGTDLECVDAAQNQFSLTWGVPPIKKDTA